MSHYDAPAIEKNAGNLGGSWLFTASTDHNKPKYYVLEMFPIHLAGYIWGMCAIIRLAMLWPVTAAKV